MRYWPVGPVFTPSSVSEPLTIPLALMPRPRMTTCQGPPFWPDQMRQRMFVPVTSTAFARTRRARREHSWFRLGRPAPGRSMIRSRPEPIVSSSEPRRAMTALPLPPCSSTSSAPGVRRENGTAALRLERPSGQSAAYRTSPPSVALACQLVRSGRFDQFARPAIVISTRSRRIPGELSSHAVRLRLRACKETVSGSSSRAGEAASAAVLTIGGRL